MGFDDELLHFAARDARRKNRTIRFAKNVRVVLDLDELERDLAPFDEFATLRRADFLSLISELRAYRNSSSKAGKNA